jgi:hypothetical protein
MLESGSPYHPDDFLTEQTGSSGRRTKISGSTIIYLRKINKTELDREHPA